MIDFILFKIDTNTLIFWFLRIVFLVIGIIYILYVLLQLRQIGIMNSTLKTRAAFPIAVIGLLHLVLVVCVMIIIEIFFFFQ